MMKGLKIAYIGGGSRSWAHTLMSDLVLCPDISGSVSLYDIDFAAAKLNEQFGNWMNTLPGAKSKWNYSVAKTLREALKGVDFIVSSITPGGLEMMEKDMNISKKYGIIHTVGDTVGPAGLMRSLRSVKIHKEFAHEIAKTCPNAWVINYTNPMTVCTRTFTAVEPKLKVFGCCHEVFCSQEFFAKIVSETFKVPLPGRKEIKVDITGVNHFTFITKATWKNHDLLDMLKKYIKTKKMARKYTKKEMLREKDYFANNHQLAIELMNIYGYWGCAGDRHLCEFVPGILKSKENMYRWGIINTPIEYRKAVFATKPALFKKQLAGKEEFKLEKTGEEGVDLILALLGIKPIMTNVNYRNNGQIENLPKEAVVETNAHFSKDSIKTINTGKIPESLYPLILRHCLNQEMIIKSVLTNDKNLGLQAFINDPQCTGTLDETTEMYNKMLKINKIF